jgi:hypothetical protein
MHTDAISSSSSATAYSYPILIYGIPLIYIVIAVLLILFVLYVLCRIKRKDRHSMEKSSYIKLFFALFVPLFLYNLYNMYDSIRFAASVISLDLHPLIMIIILTIALSLMESIFPYLFITLSILIINCYRKSS